MLPAVQELQMISNTCQFLSFTHCDCVIQVEDRLFPMRGASPANPALHELGFPIVWIEADDKMRGPKFCYPQHCDILNTEVIKHGYFYIQFLTKSHLNPYCDKGLKRRSGPHAI